MSKYSIKPITDKSWILSSNGEKLAVISQTSDGIILLGKIPKKKHATLDALILHLGGDVEIEPALEPEIEKEAAEVNGYPIKHEVWYDVSHAPIPSYTRTKSSNTRYAAGYYALKFTNGWSPSFCPKLSTLNDYEYMGPYTTKLEMQNSISQINNLPKI